MKTTKETRDAFINAGSKIEKELYQIFKKEDPIVIADIGACDGLDSIIYAKLFPNAFIHVFEPREDNLSVMLKNFEDYVICDRVKLHPYALGNGNTIMTFYESKGQAKGVEGWDTGNKSSSMLKPKEHLKVHPWCEFEEAEVEMHKLDDTGIDHIDFAHIDVQGAELMVIDGGKDIFEKTKAVWMEVANIELYESQPLRAEIINTMTICLEFRVRVDTAKHGRFGDILFVR